MLRLTLIQKLLMVFFCLLLGNLVAVSWIYYAFFNEHMEGLAKKQQETAFELIFDNVNKTVADVTPPIERFITDFIKSDIRLINARQDNHRFQNLNETALYNELPAIFSRYRKLVSAVDRFAPAHQINKLVIYDQYNTARVIYLKTQQQQSAGVFLGQHTDARYVSFGRQQMTPLGDQLIQFLSPQELREIIKPELPTGLTEQYKGGIPETVAINMEHFNALPTVHFLFSIKQNGRHAALLEIDIALREQDIQRYASYSHTAINIFANNKLSMGSLKDYDSFDMSAGLLPKQIDLLSFQFPAIDYSELTVAEVAYLQGSVTIGNDENFIIMTASNPKDELIQRRETLLISIALVVFILGLFGVLISGTVGARVNHFIQQLLDQLEQLARGDIPEKMQGVNKGQFGEIKRNFNALISSYAKTVEMAGKIAHGEFDVHLKERSEQDLLSRSLNIMAENLIQARNTLEQRVLERTAQLSESEERFRSLVNDIPGVVYRCALDKDWTMKYISEEIQTLTGYRSSDFIDNQVRSYTSVIHQQDRKMVEQVIDVACKQTQPYVLEYRVVDSSGEIHWVYEKGQANYDEQSSQQWLDGAVFDITDRKQAEQALKAYQEHLEELVEERTEELEKSNARLQQEKAFTAGVLENIEDGIVACDKDGELSLFNRASRQFHGIEEEALAAEEWAKHYRLYLADGKTPMPQEDIPLFRAFNGEKVHWYEMVIAAVNGKARSVVATGRAISGPNGEKLGAVVSMHDITASKEAGEERAINELRINLLYELNRNISELDEKAVCEQALDIAVKITDSQVGYLHMVDDDQQNLTLVTWNDEARKLCTASHDSHYPIEMAGVWADAVRLKKTVIHNDYPTLVEKKGVPEGHFPIQRHMSTPALDGDLVRMIIGVGNKETNYSPRDAQQLELVTSEAMKMVMRKRAEEALKVAKDAAERANIAKSTFLANMSHELRTPLNAILGFSQIMQTNLAIPETEQEHIDIINRSGNHLLQLINDVLDMSKIEAGRLKLEQEDFDLGELIRDTTDMMRVRAEAKGLKLILDQSSEFPRFIHGDAAKLRQILINLLSNAIKFTQAGAICLRLAVKDGANRDLVLLGEVEDTGTGIQPEDLERIFQPFEQLLESVSQKGTGLGLAITRQFVEMMQGEIGAESTPGKGSLFHFKVLVARAETGAVIKTTAEQRQVIGLEADQPSYRILIVEDQLENQLLLKQLLEPLGLNVRVAVNGKEAVEQFQQWRPHLIWMDRRMPVMGGEEATREIRKLPEGQESKIIALTASAFKDEREVILSAGMDDYISKPYRPEEIYDCMARHLNLRYQYKEALIDHKVSMPTHLNPDMLSVLPKSFLEALLDVTEAGDGEEVRKLIVSMFDKDAVVSNALMQLVDGYHFDELAVLIKAALADLKTGKS